VISSDVRCFFEDEDIEDLAQNMAMSRSGGCP